LFLSIFDFVGRFHPLAVHLPIGFLLLGIVFLWLSRSGRYDIPPHVLRLIWLLGALSAAASAVTGYLLSLTADYDASTVNWHMYMGIAVTIVSFLLFINPTVSNRKISFVLSALLLVLLTVTGHLGGTLTHGEGYLTGEGDDAEIAAPPAKNIADIQEAKLYDDVLQPIFQTKCYNCHGPQKQKGKLRMDDPQWIKKGGKNGETIIAGEPDKSEMMIRLLLPENDKKHMPPKQKAQLTEKEIDLLHWWIVQGASFDKKVKELPQNDTIKPVLLSFQGNNSQPVKATLSIPAEPVEAADPKAMQALKDRGIMVMPVASGSNYLAVNFVAVPNVTRQDLDLLSALQKQLVSLKMGHTNITDSALLVVGKCSQLMFLQLNNTNITDIGVSFLSSLKNLRSLNIVGTGISIKGIGALQKLSSLQALYLYRSRVSAADWPALKKMFPAADLDTGGYSLEKLATDTVFLKPPKTK
jgi:mono/diheme cytochrome c family protein